MREGGKYVCTLKIKVIKELLKNRAGDSEMQVKMGGGRNELEVDNRIIEYQPTEKKEVSSSTVSKRAIKSEKGLVRAGRSVEPRVEPQVCIEN